ncbi:MAG: hypothetical protein A2W01_10185 [Candidatus Solincola sediminis]|uniref:Uncharacterized protein n=1 Tax=Candidatus Solincola sediminis TaxID=1797199 RepID=A0A1F2WQ92_9ACTN|nr:MAG: hypothetical protein A2Y75_00365 [Candidatus Solincola sediminis]OFW61526.1 MAG: hypothetical protein A2W01_10185 [Candidatus Solincola sediminis]
MKIMIHRCSISAIIVVLILSVFCLSYSMLQEKAVADTSFQEVELRARSIGAWQMLAEKGFGRGANAFLAWSFAEYRGELYVGIGSEQGAEVRVKQDANWIVAGSMQTGFGNPANLAIAALKVFGDKLYAATLNYAQGCEIWQYDGNAWTCIGHGGFGDTANIAVMSMEVYDGRLYAGTLNLDMSDGASEGAQIWAYDGSAWVPSMTAGFGDTRNCGVTALKAYSGSLYAGTMRADTSIGYGFTMDITFIGKGCQLWSNNAGSWTQVRGDGITRTDNLAITSMEIFGGKLFIGTARGTLDISITISPFNVQRLSWQSQGLCIYSFDGINIESIREDGLNDGNDACALSMATTSVGDRELLLTAVGRTAAYGAMCGFVAGYDGREWFRASNEGFASSNNMLITSLESSSGQVMGGTLNPGSGCEIWCVQPAALPTHPLGSSTFYFAEGFTGDNFQEYLTLGNASASAVDATITYMFKGGGNQQQAVSVPPNSRATVDVNAAVGHGREVSVIVEAVEQIVVERPMYFNYQGEWTGGHDVIGATTPSYTWYFAEGYTGTGFDEWICVLNPGDTDAELTFRFQTEEAGQKMIGSIFVPAHSRETYKANDLLGGISYQTSLILTSSQPVIAERPMYFDYIGTNNWHWTGGHCVMGKTAPETSYYFAEGTTRSGFEEWLTLQNTGLLDITVNAVYQLGPGQGDPVAKSYSISGASRKTVFVADEVGTGKDVSVFLSCSSPFLAERPMYFNYGFGNLSATGGHCVIGARTAATEWFLAEGFTGAGFNEWLCLQNPGDTEAVCELSYYTQEQGSLPIKLVTVPPHSRQTIMVNQDAGADYQLSVRVRVASGPDIVVERPMYFNFRGWTGGHDVVGYMPEGS